MAWAPRVGGWAVGHRPATTSGGPGIPIKSSAMRVDRATSSWPARPLRFFLDVQSLYATGTPYMAMKMRKGAAKQQPKRTQSVQTAVVARTTIERADKRCCVVNVSRREFVGTISNGSATGFSIESASGNVPGWDLNPAISGMFPWLSNLARGFERFRFRKLKVDLVSSQPSTTAGRVYAAVDYDWDDLVPTTKAALMGNMSAVEAPVWSNFSLTMDPRALMGDLPTKYVSTQVRNPSNGWEPRLSYCGFLVFAFDTPTANLTYDLWVEYDVELSVPQFEGLEAEMSDAGPSAPGLVESKEFYDGAYGTIRNIVGNWTTETINGAIRYMVGGAGNTPPMTLPDSGFSGNLPVVDISALGGSRNIMFRAPIKHAGYSPFTWISTHAALASAAIYNHLGTRLGDLCLNLKDQLLDYGTEYVQGELNTNGKYAIPFIAISIAAIRAMYPTARYLGPYGSFSNTPGTSSGMYRGIDVRVF